MREGLVICPQTDNQGHSLQSVCDSAAEYLVDEFGGVTITEGRGAWRDPSGKLYRDPVWLLTTAYEPGANGNGKLFNAAEYIRSAGRQEAVYCRYASGDVEFVTAASKAIAA